MDEPFGFDVFMVALVVGLCIVVGILHFGFNAFDMAPINFCPNVCDDCVDKLILTPQDDVSACQPVWDAMGSGNSPHFARILEMDMVTYHCKWSGSSGSYEYGTERNGLIGSYETYNKNCHPWHFLGAIWQDDYEYLYTYQVQNEVQFDFCVQEYYKQHFGGD